MNKIHKVLSLSALCVGGVGAAYAAEQAIIVGEVERITLVEPTNTWSRGTMVVSGRNIIIPKNMVIDLPANRLTLQQFFTNSPPACQLLDNDPADGIPDETGLAKGDRCNGSGTGALVTILANKTNGGDIIAGEVMLEKATEAVSGIVTYISYTDGFFRINGENNDPLTGAMIRVNDPDGRHTLQQGAGCGGGPNCSADPRYGVDPDNYTFTAATGYPMCIPSTVSRNVAEFDIDRSGSIDTGETALVAVANGGGSGDLLCPQSNRPGGGDVNDSRVFAPIQLGDHVTADGNFETINGVTFLSAHTVGVSVALTTSDATVELPTSSGNFYSFQPDYIVFDEVEWDIPGYQNQRARALLIGFSTLPDPGVDIFALHADPAAQTYQELVFTSTVGCDAADGVGTCSNQGAGATTAGIFKVRLDVDFIVGAANRRSPCLYLRAGFVPGIPDANGNLITSDSRCPSAAQAIDHDFAVMAPPSRDLIGRSRHKHALHPSVKTLDFKGEANDHNGEYLNPVGLGHPEFVEINLAAVQTPLIFAGLPWNLDRRLGPGGCLESGCESTTTIPIGHPSMALDPFPFSGLDPRTQAGTPGVPTTTAYRTLSYWPLTLAQNFSWPPTDPAAQGITATEHVGLLECTAP